MGIRLVYDILVPSALSPETKPFNHAAAKSYPDGQRHVYVYVSLYMTAVQGYVRTYVRTEMIGAPPLDCAAPHRPGAGFPGGVRSSRPPAHYHQHRIASHHITLWAVDWSGPPSVASRSPGRASPPRARRSAEHSVKAMAKRGGDAMPCRPAGWSRDERGGGEP